jgi:hypothetical protein
MKYGLIYLFFICQFSFGQNWEQLNKIVQSDRSFVSYNHSGGQIPSGGHQYGISLSMDVDYAIVGAWWEGEGTLDPNEYEKYSGAAYILKRMPNGNWKEVQKLVASDGIELAFFGFSVSISGDYAIIGAPGRGGGAGNNRAYGAAYIFERNLTTDKWEEKQILHGSDQVPLVGSSTSFSRNVEISGNYAIVENYFFKRENDGVWREQSKLLKSGPKSIYGDLLIVGEHLETNDGIVNGGVAYVMELKDDVWVEKQKLVASDSKAGDRFGKSVSIFKDYIVVGAPFQNYNNLGTVAYDNSGAVYVFKKNLNGFWIEVQKIIASDRHHSDQFGDSVSIFEDKIVVGSRLDDYNENNSIGSAYVFENYNGVFQEKNKLIALDGHAEDRFGYAVDINDKYVIASAPFQDYDEFGSDFIKDNGAVYIFSADRTLKNENLSQIQFSVYPNPGNNKINVRIPTNINEGKIYITNIFGVKIIDKKIDSNEMIINISNLSIGTYFINILSKDGRSEFLKFFKN